MILGIVGPWQVVLIVVIAVLLFGGKKIPELMKGLGQGMKEFKKATNSDDKKKKDNIEEKEAKGESKEEK